LARDLIAKLNPINSLVPVQVLGELSRVLTIKLNKSSADARELLLSWSDAVVVADTTWTAFQSAMDLTVDHQISMWDALIMSVAAENKCRLLISEDFQNGFTWRGVTVVNPFDTTAKTYKLLASTI
jgi:predicted nucleic acid-binding protein